MVKRKLVLVVALIALACSQYRTTTHGDSVDVDFSMVEKGVVWLELIKGGADERTIKDFFMREVASTPGCKSIIRHWRRFMKWDDEEFYRFIMEALGRVACNDPIRDAEGNLTSFGRRRAFWQAALDEPNRIRRDLEELRAVGIVDTALALTKSYLSAEAVIRNKFSVVLFGGSSAYAVGNVNGFDLLQMPKQEDGSIDIGSVIRTFAHEMHHTGIRYCQKRHMAGVRHKDRLGLVARLVNEGIPIYYINQTKHRLPILEKSVNLTQQADARDWKRHLSRLSEIYAEAERDIRNNLDGKISDEQIMATWMTGSQGQAYVLGSDMISIIDSQLGRGAVLEVASDYRQLLVVYNRAARLAGQAGLSCYVFDDELANLVAAFTG